MTTIIGYIRIVMNNGLLGKSRRLGLVTLAEQLKLTEMKPERHWLGFDFFVWAGIQPDYTFVYHPLRKQISPAEEFKIKYLNDYRA